MLKKSAIAFVIFTIALLYIISPRTLEKSFFLNEILAATGIVLLAFHRFKIQHSPITTYIIALLSWCMVHASVSLFRADFIYYYLRNLVIFYSIFVFFVGYYLHPYLILFIKKIRTVLRFYIGVFLIIPIESFFDRFGMAVLFPAIINRGHYKSVYLFLIAINFLYAFSYTSSTASVIALFYLLLYFTPGYKFFKQTIFLCIIIFALFFMYLAPYIATIHHYTMRDDVIKVVSRTHPILGKDPNNTWRLILWYQIIVDNFPANILGIGFGTPLLHYFPIEDWKKLPSLPYVVGAHNSFIYLFGRLGIVFVIIIALIYRVIFKEYFYYRSFYIKTKGNFIFLSFFAITIIALFNPVLETPIFAGSYWLILGFLTKTIYNRKLDIALKQAR